MGDQYVCYFYMRIISIQKNKTRKGHWRGVAKIRKVTQLL